MFFQESGLALWGHQVSPFLFETRPSFMVAGRCGMLYSLDIIL